MASSSQISPRRLVGITAERATNVSNTEFPGHYPGEDLSWDLQKFNQNTTVKVTRLSNRQIEFDIVGVDASIANAFRRIMIAEIPSVAIERVYVFDNTTVIQDEVLAHRIGLVPLNVDPNIMDFRDPNDENLATDRNTIVFKVELTCTRNPNAPRGSEDPAQLYINHEFLSSHLVWSPAGEQETVFAHSKPAPTNPNIVLAKLRPGQSVNMELHAVKGVGKDHAKFSPVATASYRLHPNIVLKGEIPPDRIEDFKKCFATGVVAVDSKGKAYIDREAMRRDYVTREVLRHPDFVDKVELSRIRDHFIFGAESEGPYRPESLLPEAIKVMRAKISTLQKSAQALLDVQRQEDVTMAEP
ncbi:DNA-directed RNA polymerase core subunit rpc40 [Marasmius sp. AFHP31]|nr:DNA-directed RNA polymerase core subunit rpc40 [Marasmius sp. AFHP31]